MTSPELLDQHSPQTAPQIQNLEQFWASAQNDLDRADPENFAYIDHAFSVAKEPGQPPREVVLYDALNALVKDEKGAVIDRVPTVVLIDPSTGERETAPAETFVQWARNTQISSEVPQLQDAVKTATVQTVEPEVEVGTADSIDKNVAGDEDLTEARRDIARLDVIEKLGLPGDATPETVDRVLTERIMELQRLAATLSNFDPVRRKAIREINETLSMQQNRLTGSVRDEISNYLGSSFVELQQFHEGVVRGDTKLLLPSSQRELEGFTRSARTLRGNYDAMVQRGRNFIETDMAAQVKRTLEQMAKITDQVNKELGATESLLAETSGFSSVQKMHEEAVRKKEAEYRNDDVARWADELGSAGVTSERITEIEAEMYTAVRIEVGMVDDPNSPRVWFNEDIIRNRNKSRREGTKYSERVDADIPSQQHVAELMSDMLTGKYNVAAGNSTSPIQLSRDKLKIDSGVHRAAALAMLYGKNWQQIATQKGIKIAEK